MFIYVDNDKRITGINPNDMSGNSGWVQTDEAISDPITEELGIPLFKLVNGLITPRTSEEIAVDVAAIPKPMPSDKDYINYYGAALGMKFDGLKWVYDRNEPIAMLVFPFPIRPNCWYRAADGKLYVGLEYAWAQSVEDECLEPF